MVCEAYHLGQESCSLSLKLSRLQQQRSKRRSVPSSTLPCSAAAWNAGSSLRVVFCVTLDACSGRDRAVTASSSFVLNFSTWVVLFISLELRLRRRNCQTCTQKIARNARPAYEVRDERMPTCFGVGEVDKRDADRHHHHHI